MSKRLPYMAALLSLLIIIAGCSAAQRQAILSGGIVAASVDPVVVSVKDYIGTDEVVIQAIAEPFNYLSGRWEVYKDLDQAVEAVPLILSRATLWAKAKGEAVKIRDGLLEYEQRTNKPMPPLVSAFLTEGEAFVMAMDEAIAEKKKNVKVQYVTANLSKFALIAAGVPQLAALVPVGAGS